MFERLLQILSRPAVLVLLFCMSLTLFSWPLLGAAEERPPGQAHFTLFLLWGLVVAALWTVTRAISKTTSDADDTHSHSDRKSS